MASQEDKCPVDHKTRQAWLDKSRQASASAAQSTQTPSPAQQLPTAAGQSCDSSELSQNAAPLPFSRLGTQREVSTIPRAVPDDHPPLPLASQPSVASHGNSIPRREGRAPANNEGESGLDKSGMWIYPSEQMFFAAMKRKGFGAREDDMRTIVPIHNAVNERAWREIREWERGMADACGGPRLVSFSGLSTQMTPKARLNTILGYQAPFDRHDWVVDRCGKQIEYVIDFYAGRDEKPGQKLSFYLDVRPKLNSWEGWKMRVGKVFGF